MNIKQMMRRKMKIFTTNIKKKSNRNLLPQAVDWLDLCIQSRILCIQCVCARSRIILRDKRVSFVDQLEPQIKSTQLTQFYYNVFLCCLSSFSFSCMRFGLSFSWRYCTKRSAYFIWLGLRYRGFFPISVTNNKKNVFFFRFICCSLFAPIDSR